MQTFNNAESIGLPLELPRPTGYRVLVRLWEIPTQTAGGLYMPEEAKARHERAGIAAQVLAIGPDAYLDERKFPNGPYCKAGDWIMLANYAGGAFKFEDAEYRIINDDMPIATIPDPAKVKRI